VVLLPACSSSGDGDAETPARNVILMIGDGMGAAQREAGRLDQEGVDGRLAMDSLPVTGLQTTNPADPEGLVTDSAAAATAWATGETTYNGAISVDLDGNALPTLGLEASAAGRATGLVTTSEVTDASPAAFFSNVPDRDSQETIARQYLEFGGPSVIFGGGEDVWTSGEDLLGTAEEGGYELLTDAEDLGTDGERLLGLFAEGPMYEEEEPEVSLAEMTQAALDVLSRNEDGFFLVVEEEGIDAAGHDNDEQALLEGMRSLDDAVEVARDFVAKHPQTLLIVAGDHETGGLSVEGVSPEDEGDDDTSFPVAGSDRRFDLDWTTGDHTGVPTPVSAEGPGSGRLSGSYANTRLHGVMRDALLPEAPE
jgi:alkaline phosphatase